MHFFLRSELFDGQCMERFDKKAEKLLRLHRDGLLSSVDRLAAQPTEDNFQDKKFWPTYKLPGKIFLRTGRKKRNGALLREGSKGLHIPPSDKKVRL